MQDRINHTTGLYNTDLFEVLFNHEVARSKRYPSPISLLRLGIVLDNPSHTDSEIWESATLNVAHVLNSSLRQVDVPAHCDDNFWVLLPATEEEGAKIVAKRLIERLSIEQVTRSNHHFWMGLCIGLASHAGGPTLAAGELMVQASHALEEAIKCGRNVMVTYRELVRID
ncbi:MAG: diguanylate cyclase [Chloroflexota bacterium]